MDNYKNFFNKKNFKSQGFSTLTAIMFALGIATLSVFVMKSGRLRTQQGIKLSADKDVEGALYMLSSYFSSSYHCNANLKDRGLAAVTYVASPLNEGVTIGPVIKKCTGASCNYASGTNSIRVDYSGIYVNTWSSDITGFPISGTTVSNLIPSRIRIVKAMLSIDTSYPYPASAGEYKPWTARLSLRFEKNLGQRRPDNTLVTSFVDRVIHFPVTLSSRTDPINSTTILGCPRSANSTVLP